MNEPKTPNNSRDWESIDIFLFSNGQQYSPPRKYHLQGDNLNSWNATKKFLARSQFGSMHSNIELYTLDGKKVEGPLELKNSAAYVAVEPPDSFISAGYEKYLIKASRSWEKRQDKISKIEDKTNEGKTGLYLEHTTIEQVQGIIALSTISENSTLEPVKLTTSQNNTEKPTISKVRSASSDKSHPKSKQNSINSDKDVFQKKNKCCPTRINNNEQTSFKKKNMPFVKNFKSRNNKQQPVTYKNSNIANKQLSKDNENTDNVSVDTDKTLQNLKNTKIYSNEFNNKKQQKQNNEIITRDLEAIFTEAGRENTLIDNSRMARELSIENLLDEADISNNLEKDNPLYKVDKEIQNSKRKLNIKLRIKIEDSSNAFPENRTFLEKKTSIITFIKEEKASQVNIDVILSKNIFAFNKNIILNNKYIDSNKIKYDGYNPIFNKNKDIVVDCACENVSQVSNTSNGLYYQEAGSNDILLFSNAINERIIEICKCNQTNIETVDIGIQKSYLSNTTLNSTNDVKGKSKNIGVTLQRKDSMETYSNLVSDYKDDIKPSKTFIDRYVQTEWCNVLLQVKCQATGRYTFHLPSLSMLKHYNINQIYYIFYLFQSQKYTST